MSTRRLDAIVQKFAYDKHPLETDRRDVSEIQSGT